MIAASLGEEADNSRSKSNLVHLSQSSTGWSGGGFDKTYEIGMIAGRET